MAISFRGKYKIEILKKNQESEPIQPTKPTFRKGAPRNEPSYGCVKLSDPTAKGLPAKNYICVDQDEAF